ncbi:murein hydrolase activator EnvC family protein [Hydrogenimonas thermophila]|uniref:Septal ring factor EnvC, activator of murein hydrolases AmiA and AmiB n=1 Tax=Hydrogenimonas thermophila TaxID=223786 RepID=A0A1I5NPE1_9BACT|nr:peptidoglycan DD-metalloendopeptidase family protein [Hydrogenimonas thermophila]SFP23520.1 Septal ring factor EnvC, activator of murein hydrolases AmiA and AmiB [Hydrogenimonas thermophila]
MRILFLLFLSISLIYASSIDVKIASSKKKLRETKNSYAYMDKKLAGIAKEIKKNESELKKLDRILKDLDSEIERSSKILSSSEERLKKIQKELKILEEKKRAQENQFAKMIANSYILEYIKKDKGLQSPDDVIENEVLEVLIHKSTEQIGNMEKSLLQTINKKEQLDSEAQKLISMIDRLKSKKDYAAKEKKRKTELLSLLETEKKKYQQRLERLQKEERDLRNTLARLNIIKREEIERRKKQSLASKNRKKIDRGNKLKVRKIGSSFQKHAIGRYRGPKTISPVGKAKVVKKFGVYTDPVYKIKIFNESITLKPYKKNAKVKNVLNGRVVFAKDTPVLGKVVIVEHKNNLHTIYAKIDKIAPTIKEGKKIKKGYVIGRIKKELMFEVTQKNRHINPLELINLK